jgi:tRNA (cmo5U34)-methyltransferase
MQPLRGHTQEDWFDDSFVSSWIQQNDPGSPQRRRHFAMVRAHIPFPPDASFRYLNVGAGWGSLDELILKTFPQAEVTLQDGSPLMLARAREALASFGNRVTYTQADFATPGWSKALQGPYDVAVSTIAIHNLFDAARIRAVYAELFPLMADGGLFVNLDLVRLESPGLSALARWVRGDPEAGLAGGGGGGRTPGTMAEQLGWLREAGFIAVDCFWREYGYALFGGWRGHIRVPEPA